MFAQTWIFWFSPKAFSNLVWIFLKNPTTKNDVESSQLLNNAILHYTLVHQACLSPLKGFSVSRGFLMFAFFLFVDVIHSASVLLFNLQEKYV